MMEITELQKLVIGIEIVSAMKADCYNLSIEDGRELALSETEVDLWDEEHLKWVKQNNFDKRHIELSSINKKRLHKQAMFVANAALKAIEKLTIKSN